MLVSYKMKNIALNLFDGWNEVKKKLQQKDRVRFFRERQIWWSNVGQNLGSESYGKGGTFTRPVLIFKKISGELFLGFPLTSKKKTGTWFVSFRHKNKQITALLHQARVWDKKRLVCRYGEVDDSDFIRISVAFNELYCPKNIRPAVRRGSMGKSQK